MKLVSYRIGDAVRYGVVKGDRVIDLSTRLGFADIVGFIAGGGMAQAQALLQTEAGEHAFDALTLLPVVPNPGKIFCIGLNYADHVAEADRKLGGREIPKKPM